MEKAVENGVSAGVVKWGVIKGVVNIVSNGVRGGMLSDEGVGSNSELEDDGDSDVDGDENSVVEGEDEVSVAELEFESSVGSVPGLSCVEELDDELDTSKRYASNSSILFSEISFLKSCKEFNSFDDLVVSVAIVVLSALFAQFRKRPKRQRDANKIIWKNRRIRIQP